MIGWLSGRVVDSDGAVITIDVAGVGYEVEVTSGVLAQQPLVGETLTVHAHMVVRDDAHLLFGFTGRAERDLFRALIKVNGVGPKLGLTVISGLGLEGLTRAIAERSVKQLTQISGVGKKTAERLVMELGDTLAAWADSVSVHAAPTPSTHMPEADSVRADAVTALESLGYRPAEAERMIARALEQNEAEVTDAETLLRLALRGQA